MTDKLTQLSIHSDRLAPADATIPETKGAVTC
jgi:hypothetical protein